MYNNEPLRREIPYDPSTKPEDIRTITEGVEPGEYFEFTFQDVFIRKVTYDDGTSTDEKEKDGVIGKKLIFKGFLVDVAPHLLQSRLFAGEFRIIDLVMGKLGESFESDLFTTIQGNQNPGNNGEGLLPYSAGFECRIHEMQSLAGDFISSENSRFFREFDLENSKFKMYFHLSKFYYSTLQGEVHGYIGLYVPEFDDRGVRIHGRRLLVDPSISEDLKRDFRIDPYKEESEDVFRKDLEGTYEILKEKKLGVLRYLNFIPYLDANNTPPSGYTFFIKLLNNGKEIESYLPSEIKVDRNSISYSGGISIIPIPDNMEDLSKLSMSILTKKNDVETKPYFMIEPEFDLLINNDQKYLVLESSKKEELKVQVYQKNLPSKNKNVRVILQTHKNSRSPTVARWTTSESTSDNESQLTSHIQAHDLEHSEEIDDIRGKISGDLPWDRYYGNYLSIKIDNNSIESDDKKKPTIKFNIPVRVLHSVRLDDKLKEAIDNLDKEKIQEVMTKILSYYVRYYPWLHTEYAYTDLPKPAKLAYSQFLNITKFLVYVDKNDIGNWGSLQKSVDGMNHFLDRLIREDNDWKKMPRSRDFPFNGVEFLKMYKASVIDKMVSAINEEQDRIIKSIGGSEIEINMENWRQIQTLLNSLGDMTNRLSSDEDKKLIAIWKLQIYDSLIHDLSHAKAHTKHVHEH